MSMVFSRPKYGRNNTTIVVDVFKGEREIVRSSVGSMETRIATDFSISGD
ncbi:hypothetical protein KS419_19560 [Bacillus tamaricis]|uniref:Uncharacterized protein n=1 Tax=Evansella tamaricis TaxID=2069301 RepID=A0ABS6JNQ2_9BACI|nr:hypothetical protein [Evansella tamaricis]MBU9713933.1 hypothetical protein [Evansella tamaricis]